MGTYRKIAPSIMREAGAQADSTETLYDVKGHIADATVDVDKATKFTKASGDSLRTARYLDLMGLRDELTDQTDAESQKALDAFKILEGWHTVGGGDWYNVLGLGSHYNYSLPLNAEYKGKGE